MPILRLRHPKGVSSIDLDIDNDNTKVSDLQQAILFATEIPSSKPVRHAMIIKYIMPQIRFLCILIPMNNQSRLTISHVRLL
ncbi:MAG TPA: hypothetical protein VGO47_03630 [Chlamydiales bacterium]|nr:hypothetical protein [Chlamydiales bacterium]